MSRPKFGRLAKVKVQEVWNNEADEFIPWLALEENLSMLGETLAIDLKVEGRGKNTGPFPAGLICKDRRTNQWVVIENPIARSNHAQLGHILTSAAGLNSVTIVWMAGQFTKKHRSVLDWLNKITDRSVRFFGLEIEFWQIGDSPFAPNFKLICIPEGWTPPAGQMIPPPPPRAMAAEKPAPRRPVPPPAQPAARKPPPAAAQPRTQAAVQPGKPVAPQPMESTPAQSSEPAAPQPGDPAQVREPRQSSGLTDALRKSGLVTPQTGGPGIRSFTVPDEPTEEPRQVAPQEAPGRHSGLFSRKEPEAPPTESGLLRKAGIQAAPEEPESSSKPDEQEDGPMPESGLLRRAGLDQEPVARSGLLRRAGIPDTHFADTGPIRSAADDAGAMPPSSTGEGRAATETGMLREYQSQGKTVTPSGMLRPLDPGEQGETQSGMLRRVEEDELQPDEKLYIEFWTQFRNFMIQRGSELMPPQPTPQSWMPFGIGRQHFYLIAFLSAEFKRGGMGLVMWCPSQLVP